MEQTELDQFKRTLEEMLAGLKDPLRRREEISIEISPDTLDEVQNAADRELAIRQLEIDSGKLRSLLAALQRIEDGTYGICASCEMEISLKRLKAVPWASLCLECQSIADLNNIQADETQGIRFAEASPGG